MRYKKIMLILITAIFLVSIASVYAEDANDTLVASEDTNQIELSSGNQIIEDNLQTTEENTTFAQTDNDESISVETDSQILSETEGTYYDLREEIGNGGNKSLTKSYYSYTGGYTIEVTTSGVINGNGAVIDMAGSNIRAFYVTSSDVTIKNLTIKNVNYNEGIGGAVYFDDEGEVINCNFVNNTAGNGGGAIWFSGNGAVENCNFVNNTAGNGGGAIYFEVGLTGRIENCNFIDNEATNYKGGAIYMYSGIVENCNFVNNTACEDGGAVWMEYGTVTNSKFSNNVCGRSGAILSDQWCGVIADTCIFKTDSDTTYNTDVHPPTLNADNFTTSYGSGEKLTFDLKTYSNRTVDNGIISISVYYKNNDAWVGNYSCLSGEGWTVDLPAGSYYAVFNTEYAGFKPVNRTIIINKVKTELTAKAITATYNSNKKMVIILTDINGKPLNGVKLTVKIKSDKTYTTDKNGQVKISVGKLTPKTYNVKITFGENANYLSSSANVKVTVKKAKSKITAKKKTVIKAKKYTVTLKSGKKPIKKVKVILKIKKKTFKAKTNKKGKATFKIKKLKKGTYTAKVTFKGNKYYKKSTKKVKIVIG